MRICDAESRRHADGALGLRLLRSRCRRARTACGPPAVSGVSPTAQAMGPLGGHRLNITTAHSSAGDDSDYSAMTQTQS